MFHEKIAKQEFLFPTFFYVASMACAASALALLKSHWLAMRYPTLFLREEKKLLHRLRRIIGVSALPFPVKVYMTQFKKYFLAGQSSATLPQNGKESIIVVTRRDVQRLKSMDRLDLIDVILAHEYGHILDFKNDQKAFDERSHPEFQRIADDFAVEVCGRQRVIDFFGVFMGTSLPDKLKISDIPERLRYQEYSRDESQ